MTSGKVVVITGATRGIGHGLARELTARGSQVALCGRQANAVKAAVAELGGDTTGIAADVRSRDDLQRLWDHAADRFGRVDVWINNAGMSVRRVPFAELAPADVRAIVETNLLGVMNGAHVAVSGMMSQGHGQLWNMEGFGSNGQTAVGIAAYGATKRAVSYFTKALLKELKDQPVQVNYLSPGIVATDLLVDDYAGDADGLAKAKKIFNILGDRVETVTPWLADHVLATDRSGARVAWLTRRKAAARFATAFRRRDIFTEPATT